MLALPFPGASFDIVTTGYGLRNVPDLAAAIDEIAPRAEAGRPAAVARFQPPGEPRRARGLSRVSDGGRRRARLDAAPRSRHLSLHPRVRQYPGAEAVARMLEARGFTGARYYPVLGGLMAIHHAIRN